MLKIHKECIVWIKIIPENSEPNFIYHLLKASKLKDIDEMLMVRAYGVHYHSARASGRQKSLKIRFYYFCQKEAIIRKARELNGINFQENKIQIYHRISVSTLEMRQE